MIKEKPRTAATGTRGRNSHRRTGSQPLLKGISSGQVTPFNNQTMASSRQTKRDCSKLMNFDIFNINGVMGNKAIMATTSPSLLMNSRPRSRVKTSAKLHRNHETDMGPIHHKPMTQSGMRTHRLVKSSMSDRESLKTQSLIHHKDQTITRLKAKLVSGC